MKTAVIVGTLVVCSGIAGAQYRNPYNNMTWNNSFSRMVDMTNSMNQSLMSQMNRINLSRSLLKRQHQGGQSAAPSAPAEAPKVTHRPITATDFKRADQGRPVIERFVAGFPQLAPADRATLKQALEQSLANFDKEARKNNVATSFAIATAAALHVANGYDVPDDKSDELVFMLNDALASAPQWKQMSARDKQTLSDAILVYAAMMLNLAGQPDEGVKQAGVTMAREFLSQMGGAPSGG
jgi:hypothetical protein